jgi:probable rRNA maturation factor
VKGPHPTAVRQPPCSGLLIVAVTNCHRDHIVNRRLRKEVAAALLADLRVNQGELGIVLVAVPQMTRLNEQFLRHQGSTDVIAFDYGLGVPPSSGIALNNARGANRSRSEPRTLHGEIFICLDEARDQAKKFKTFWQSEVVRYLVHGVLHLLGHDDRRAAGRRKMKAEEHQRLRRLSRRFALSKLGSKPRLRPWHQKVC